MTRKRHAGDGGKSRPQNDGNGLGMDVSGNLSTELDHTRGAPGYCFGLRFDMLSCGSSSSKDVPNPKCALHIHPWACYIPDLASPLDGVIPFYCEGKSFAVPWAR